MTLASKKYKYRSKTGHKKFHEKKLRKTMGTNRNIHWTRKNYRIQEMRWPFFCNLAFLEKKIIFSSLDDIIMFLNPLLSDIDHDAEIICLGALTYVWRPKQSHVSLKLWILKCFFLLKVVVLCLYIWFAPSAIISISVISAREKGVAFV
jgi:hypothetical protein